MTHAHPEDAAEIVRSEAYLAALEDQLDGDSKTGGQRLLADAIERSDGPEVAGLRARLTAGRAARRFRKEQVAFMPPAVPAKDPRAVTRRSIGAQREHMARQLAWAAAQAEAWGVPSPTTLDALRMLDAKVRDLDVEMCGPEADAYAHYIWPGERDPRAPWAGTVTVDPDAGDVAVLLLLGADATWSDGEVVLTSGAVAAEAWGYELEADETVAGRSYVVAAPAIARWHTTRKDATRTLQVAAAGGPSRRRNGSPFLNASLRTLVLPLDVVAANGGEDASTGQGDVPQVFMPAQWRRVEANAAQAAERLKHAGIPADGVHSGDIGFGVPRLLRTTLFLDHEGPELVFGASSATLAESDNAHRYWTSRPATCISLWETQQVVTLTIERLAPLTEDDGITGRLGSPVDQDLLGVLVDLIAGTDIAVGFSLEDVFGTQVADTVGSSLSRATSLDVRDLRIKSTERIRGRALTEGFYCVTVPDASAVVGELLDGSLRDSDADQSTGAPASWEPLELVTEPAEAGATGAIREDSRAALINLEALSIWHEYYSFGGGGMLATTLPYVAHRAVAEREFGKMIAGLRVEYSDEHLEAAFDGLEAVRVSTLERRLAYQLNDGERFRNWTVPTHLATELLRRTRGRMQEQDARAEEVATLLQSRLERFRDRLEQRRDLLEQGREVRREKVDRVVRVLSPVAALAVLVGLYSALTTLPSSSAQNLLSAIPDAAAVTLAIVALGLIVGRIIEWLKGR